MVFIRAKCGFFSPEVVFFRFKKKRKIKKIKKCRNTRAAGQKWPNLGQIWVNFGQKGPFSNFPQKTETVIFFQL